MLQQFPNAENMIGIADGDAAMQTVGAHDDRHPGRGLRRITPLGFGNQTTLGNPMPHKVVAPHATFAEDRIGGRTPGRDHHGSDALMKQIEGVIKPRLQDR